MPANLFNDALKALSKCDFADISQLSESEQAARYELILKCADIADNYVEVDLEDD